jgi:hypothetical protein
MRIHEAIIAGVKGNQSDKERKGERKEGEREEEKERQNNRKEGCPVG